MRDFLIAHRGESYDAPENTLAAVNLAWKRGAKSVEIDVQLTVDNEVVVIHDSDTHRITGVKKIIRKSTLAELRRLDFGSYKDQQWKDECIPTLQEVLETVPPEGKLIIEIKSDHSILDMLKGELDKTGLKESQIEIIAFDFQTLAKAKQMMPDNKMLWLLDLDYSWPHWLVHINKDRLVRRLRK